MRYFQGTLHVILLLTGLGLANCSSSDHSMSDKGSSRTTEHDAPSDAEIASIIDAAKPTTDENGQVISLPGYTVSKTVADKGYVSLDDVLANKDAPLFDYEPPESSTAEYSEPQMVTGASLRLQADTDSCTKAAYSTAKPRYGDLPSVSGTYFFCIQVSFANGTTTFFQTPVIVLKVNDDNTPPEVSVFTVNEGSLYTASRLVDISYAAGDATEVYLTNTPACLQDGVWEAVSPGGHVWTILDAQGEAKVYAKFRDSAGNESECATATINYDSVPPTIPSVSDGDATLDLSAAPLVSWASANDEGAGVSSYEVALGSTPGGDDIVPWTPVLGSATSYSFTGLTLNADAGYYGSVRATDALGHTSSAVAGDGFVTGYIAVLDTSFNATGYHFQNGAAGGSAQDAVKSVAMQADGKIVLAGESFNGTDLDMTVWRFNSDGTLDTSFAGDGSFSHNGAAGGNGIDTAKDVLVLPSGKILVVGNSEQPNTWDDIILWRLNSDGTLDSSFDGDGIAIFGATPLDEAEAMAVQPDGKIVVVGDIWGDVNVQDMLIVRFNADGSLDTSFNGSGYASHDSAAGGHYVDVGRDVIIQANGRILVAGNSHRDSSSGSSDAVVWRFNADGTLDSSFGNNGCWTHHSAAGGNGDDVATQLAEAPDGTIAVAGHSHGNTSMDFTVWRLSSTGSLDASFNGSGFWSQDNLASNDKVHALVVQSDGSVLFGGSAGPELRVGRILTTGSRDPLFGPDNGYYARNTSTSSGGGNANDMLLDQSGNLIMGGTHHNGSDEDMAVWRLLLRP